MQVKTIFSAPVHIFRIARGKGMIQKKDSENQKGFWKRCLDLWTWYFKYGEVLLEYYIYGFDVKRRQEQKEYMGNQYYVKLLKKKNIELTKSAGGINYRALTFDKYVSNNYLQTIGVPAVRNEAIIMKNRVHWSVDEEGGLDSLLDGGYDSLYVKPIYGSFGLGIIRLDLEDQAFFYKGERLEIEDLEKKLTGAAWVVQKKAVQHPELDQFNSSTANTLRVVTMLNKDKPEFVTSIMKFGMGKSHVDNWEAGGLATGVQHPEGMLWDRAFFKPNRHIMESCTEHPDSKIPFKGYKIPFYQEAVEVALRVHKFYYGRFMLALDFAITEQGPMIIAINCNPGHRTIQMTSGGLKKRMTKS